MGLWWNPEQNIQKLLVNCRGLWWGKKSLEVQQFLGGLDSKQKPGSLNIALIHTYFLEWDYQRTKQLIHGNVFFFLYLVFLLTWLELSSQGLGRPGKCHSSVALPFPIRFQVTSGDAVWHLVLLQQLQPQPRTFPEDKWPAGINSISSSLLVISPRKHPGALISHGSNWYSA